MDKLNPVKAVTVETNCYSVTVAVSFDPEDLSTLTSQFEAFFKEHGHDSLDELKEIVLKTDRTAFCAVVYEDGEVFIAP